MRPENEKAKVDLAAALAAPPAPPRFEPHFVRNRDVMLRFLEGQSIEQISFDLRLEPKQIKAILRRAPIKREIQRLAGLANDRYVQERVDTLSIEALDVIRDTMRGQQFSELRFKAAKEILDKNPLLKANAQGSGLKELGEGLGEAIINRLTQIESTQAREQQEIDVTPAQQLEEEKDDA